eukprot:3810051-Prymnesium_polylepis.1
MRRAGSALVRPDTSQSRPQRIQTGRSFRRGRSAALAGPKRVGRRKRRRRLLRHQAREHVSLPNHATADAEHVCALGNSHGEGYEYALLSSVNLTGGGLRKNLYAAVLVPRFSVTHTVTHIHDHIGVPATCAKRHAPRAQTKLPMHGTDPIPHRTALRAESAYSDPTYLPLHPLSLPLPEQLG